MFTMPLDTLLQMTKIRRHEELAAMGALCIFLESLGRAMFVSHQWTSRAHPDPSMKQFAVLQKTLKNLHSGNISVSHTAAEELWYGKTKCPTPADFNGQALYIWYDYFSCPQGTDATAVNSREAAIESIPAYCARSFFFLILCPSVPHTEHAEHILSYATWAERGWCRLERMARDLARDDGFVIRVEHADSPQSAARELWTIGAPQSPGRGYFTIEDDRKKIAPVLVRMLWNKLMHYIEREELHNYRFLLSLQRLYLDGLDATPLEALVPNFDTDIDPVGDPARFIVARYLHDTGFQTVTQYDKAGWSPICYATMTGDAFLVKALLESRADPQDRLQKAKDEAFMGVRLPILSMAGAYHSNEVMEILLSARADVNARDVFKSTALHWSAQRDNAEGIRILCEANIDPNLRLQPSLHAFKVACGTNSLRAMDAMRRHVPVSLRYCLHFALACWGNDKTISYLIEASADINEQLRLSMTKETGWWMMMRLTSAKHWIRPSALTYLAYHHRGATPLMFSLITGRFAAASVLLKAGARLDLKNARGKCAADFLHGISVPVHLSISILSPAETASDASDAESDDSFSI